MPWSEKPSLARFPIQSRGEAHQSHLMELSTDSSCLLGCYTINILRVTFKINAKNIQSLLFWELGCDYNQHSKKHDFHLKCFVILQ